MVLSRKIISNLTRKRFTDKNIYFQVSSTFGTKYLPCGSKFSSFYFNEF